MGSLIGRVEASRLLHSSAVRVCVVGLVATALVLGGPTLRAQSGTEQGAEALRVGDTVTIPPGEFQGRVMTNDNQPLADTMVSVFDQSGNRVVQMRTDAQGYFTIPEGLDPGEYLIGTDEGTIKLLITEGADRKFLLLLFSPADDTLFGLLASSRTTWLFVGAGAGAAGLGVGTYLIVENNSGGDDNGGGGGGGGSTPTPPPISED